MHRAPRGRGVGLVVLLLLLSACSVFGDGEAPSTPASDAAPVTPEATEVSVTPRAAVAGGEEDATPRAGGQKPPKPEGNGVEPTGVGAERAEGEEPEAAFDPDLDDWTIFLYMSAGPDQDAAALETLNDMEAAGPSEGINVIVQLDRNRAADDEDEWSGARRYRIQADDDLTEINSELLEELGTTNMGDPDSLGEFLVSGQQAFPANRYALILWGAGGAWRGLVHDATEEDDLSMGDLSGGLERALADMAPEQLDIVGIDGGLTAHLEILSAVQPYARYAVASPGLAQAGGWDYGAFLQAIQGEEALRAEQAAQLLAMTAPAEGADAWAAPVTVDLHQIAAVETSLQALSDALVERAALSAPTIARARHVAEVSTLNVGPGAGAFAAVDVGRFAAHLAQIAPWRELVARAEALEEAARTAVLDPSDGEDEDGENDAGILLAFLPDGEDAAAYEAVAVGGWDELQRTFYEASRDGGYSAAGAIGIQGPEQPGAQRPALLGLEARTLNVDSVNLVALRPQAGANGRLMVVEPLPAGAQPEGAGHPWADGVYHEEVVWDATAPYISDGANGDFAPVWPTADGAGQTMVAARYAPTEGAAREAILLFDETSGQLQNVWQAGTEGETPRQLVLSNGDGLQLYNVFLDENRQFTYEPGVTLVYSDGTDIGYDYFPLPSGDYDVGLLSRTASGDALAASRTLSIANEDLTPGYEAYLNRAYGFQFLYPQSWP
ncbi:MAG: clostripain-related cysteine peptidase, partial [Chloroflexota bacterium]